MRTERFLLSLVTLAVGSTLVACSGGGGGGPAGPTAPVSAPMALTTNYGTATVFTNGYDFDSGRARASVEQGYLRARQQVGSRIDAISISGLEISVRPGEFNGAVGQYHPNDDTIEMAQHIEHVIEHELQHRFCHALGNSGQCCTLQDHAGGYDLSCNRV